MFASVCVLVVARACASPSSLSASSELLTIVRRASRRPAQHRCRSPARTREQRARAGQVAAQLIRTPSSLDLSPQRERLLRAHRSIGRRAHCVVRSARRRIASPAARRAPSTATPAASTCPANAAPTVATCSPDLTPSSVSLPRSVFRASRLLRGPRASGFLLDLFDAAATSPVGDGRCPRLDVDLDLDLVSRHASPPFFSLGRHPVAVRCSHEVRSANQRNGRVLVDRPGTRPRRIGGRSPRVISGRVACQRGHVRRHPRSTPVSQAIASSSTTDVGSSASPLCPAFGTATRAAASLPALSALRSATTRARASSQPHWWLFSRSSKRSVPTQAPRRKGGAHPGAPRVETA